jgi:hypothetical protein
MSRRAKIILVASHLLLLLAGGWVAWQTVGRGGFFRQESAVVQQGKTGQTSERDIHGKPFFATNEWRGLEYARAWKAVRNLKHTTQERIRLQRDLLESWAEADLPAAIEAALGEAWDRDGGGELDPCGPLLDVFSAALAKNPQEGWDMIRGRQFGVGTGMLRHVWMEAVGVSDPLFLATRLAELSWRDRARAVEICHQAVQDPADAATKAELYKVLASYPPEMVGAEQLMKFASLSEEPVDLAGMKQEIIRLGSEDERMAKVKAMLYGRQLATRSADEVAEGMEGLPEGVREELVWAAFQDSDKPEDVLGLADLLIEEQAWGKLQRPEVARLIQKAAGDGRAAELAGWAMSLPTRIETTGLFDAAVEIYFVEHPKPARAWLAELPPGVWRDRALAAYSKASLNVHANTRASRWALNQIGDLRFKNEAEDWRAQWERRTGWAEK